MNYSISYFNWAEINNQILLTNDIGKYCFIIKNEFFDFVNGILSSDSNIFDILKERGFLYQDIKIENIIYQNLNMIWRI